MNLCDISSISVDLSAMESGSSIDEDGAECLICCNTFGSENRAVFLPCCRKTVCGCCVELLPIPPPDPERKCPFCRRFVRLEDLREDFKSHARGQRITAKVQGASYPFQEAPCRNCSRLTRFPDFFICFSCYPSQIDRGFRFHGDEVKTTALCALCMLEHQDDRTHLSESLTIFTTERLDLLADHCASIFPEYQLIPLIPAFIFCLIKSAFIRLQKQEFPSGLLKWLSQSSITFVQYAENEQFRGEKLRRSTELFIKSYWSLMYTALALIPGILDLEDLRSVLESVNQVAHIAVTLTIPLEDFSVATKAAAERNVWDDCLPIFKEIKERIQKTDGHQLSEARMMSVNIMLSTIECWFLSVETNFVLELIEEERRNFNEILCDPSTSVETQRALTKYQNELNLSVERIDELRLERILCIAEEERSLLYE